MTLSHDSEKYDRLKELKEFDDTKIGVKGLADSGVTTIPRFFIHPPENLTGLKPSSTTAGVPAIDLSGVNSYRRSEIVQQIREAAHSWGFFQLTNHGVPESIIDEAIGAIKSFNEQPIEVRAQHYSREIGGGVSFSTNFDLYRSKAATWRDTLQVRTGPVLPELDRIPGVCRNEILAWNEQAKGLAEVVMELLCEGLGVDKGRLKELSCLESSTLVAHYYPKCPQPDLTLGLGSHTDPGVLTIVIQDTVGGLQVKHGDEWVVVEPIPGAIVVNIGDLLQMISNDEYKSVEHRVLANSFQDPRISIAIFFNPGKRGETDYYGPLPELLSPGKPAVYQNFTLPEFMGKLFKRELGSMVNQFKL